MTEIKATPISVQSFVFDTPLYAECVLPSSISIGIDRPIDGHCFDCERDSTFIRAYHSPGDGMLKYVCSRNADHTIWIYYRNDGFHHMKVGQIPSYADLTKIEILKYKNVLDRDDLVEFRRAIGLAAAGIGVGAFVYLRRIFERLIDKRYNEVKADNTWSDTDFYKKSMAEKISFLREYLPDFMSKNPRLYSVISQGIHQLSEQQCLRMFDVVKQSIIFILEEDSIRKEKIESRKRIEQELQKMVGLLGTDAEIPE